MGITADNTALVSAWHELQARHARATSSLERRLGVSEYEVLERLAGSSDGKSRMQELADAVHLSQSALSRVVARLEIDGLVLRDMCSEDRRGIFARVTDSGRERYEAARPTHREVLAETLG